MNTETINHVTRANLREFGEIINAVALHASTDKARAVLCAIQITQTTITATNSYTLAQWTPDNTITTGEPALIDARELTTALNNLIKATGKNHDAQITLTTCADKWLLTAYTNETTNADQIGQYSGRTLGAEYPNTKQLLTPEPCGQFEPTGYAPEYLETITKASRKISKTTPLIMTQWINPQKPTLFTTTTMAGTLTQILMPQRINQK